MHTLKSIINTTVKPVISYPITSLFLVFCLTFPFWFHPIQKIGTGSHLFLNAVVVFVAVAFVYISLFITYLIEKWNHFLASFLLSVIWIAFLMISVPSAFLMYCFQVPFSAQHIQLLRETNFHESSEFLSTYVYSDNVLVLLVIYAAAYVIIVLLCSLIRKTRLSQIYYWSSVSAVAMICLISIGYLVVKINCFGQNWDKTDIIEYSPIHQFYYAFKQYHSQIKEFDMCIENQKTYSVDSCNFTSSNIVLVIGESYNRHHSSLYGYTLPTNPRLEKRSGIYVFSDVITNVAVTHKVFQSFLSCASIDSNIRWYNAPLFPKVFRDAGYYVTFNSNQYICGANQDTWDSYASFINMKGINDVCFDLRNTH